MAEKKRIQTKPGSRIKTASGGIRRSVRKGLKDKAEKAGIKTSPKNKAKVRNALKDREGKTAQSFEKRLAALEKRLSPEGDKGKPESDKDKMARLRSMRKGAKKK